MWKMISKILIVEDDSNQRDGLRSFLGNSGFAVQTAADGREALQRIQQEKFDLLLLDIWMPRMNGLELLSRLPSGSRPEVVVMTADETTETLLQALHERAIQYITKPFHPKELVKLIRTTLDSPSAAHQVEVLSAQPHWVELRFPCDHSTAEHIQDFLHRLDSELPSYVRESVEMAFHELLMNAIEWGGHLNPDAKVQIAFLRTERLLIYRIADPGKGFNPAELEHAAIHNTADNPDAHTHVRHDKGIRPGGFGILLARSLVDELVYNEAHNEVVMIKHLH